jgi:hypothetical protein
MNIKTLTKKAFTTSEILKLGKETPLKDITGLFEEILVEDSYGEISDVLLIEEEIIICKTSEDKIPVIVIINGEYDKFSIDTTITSICDYFDRVVCRPKFTIYRVSN